jgi:hypothetical protein
MSSSPFLIEKKEYRGHVGGAWADRRAVQLERDGKLIEFVNRYQMLTTELGCALLGWPRTRANLKIVERRLRRLAEDGKHFHQVLRDGILYTLSLEISPRKKEEQSQLVHRYMEARRWATLEMAIPIANKRTARQLRQQGAGSFIPDGFCTINGTGYFWEDNTGNDNFADISAKCTLYYRDREYLAQVFGVASFRVVWTSKLKSRVNLILDSAAGIGSGGLFLVTHEEEFSPFIPQSILEPIFWSPKDRQQHSLL